jgi:hypothetical protein
MWPSGASGYALVLVRSYLAFSRNRDEGDLESLTLFKFISTDVRRVGAARQEISSGRDQDYRRDH